MLNSLTSIVLSNGINRDEEIIRADLLENPFSLVSIENLGHRDTRETAEVSKGFVGQVHLLEGETVTTRIDLTEPAPNPGQKLEQPQVS
jgi:ethanolamine utilization cobalamin adenosyltransferase